MNLRIGTCISLAAATVAALVGSPAARGQSADALINKLVTKGILTEQEAKELRQEADQGFTKAFQAKTGFPDWVTSFKIGGDFRGRIEQFTFDHEGVPDRLRYRYRLRVGAVAVLKDNFEVGFRLTSDEPVRGGTDGDPISSNTTFQNNASKKWVFIDLAYGKWTPLKTDRFADSVAIGKIENPFIVSDIVFDPDYTPEGAANSFAFRLNDQHTFRLIGGGFVLDELATTSKDPWLYGAQLLWDAQWFPHLGTALGVSGLGIDDQKKLTATNVPDVNTGNTRIGGVLHIPFNPVIADAAITYTFDQFPLFPGAFPIKLYGEFVHNPPAESQNSAWMAGIGFGRSGKKGTWGLDYRYKYIEADAWWEELTDSDFGALRPAIPPAKPAYGAGTNVKGHVVRATYSPYDALTLGVTFFGTELVRNFGLTGDGTGRLQVDALWKF